MSEQSPWTILRLLQWTTEYLQQHGSATARLDAEVLLAHARGCGRIDLYTSFDELASEELRERFRQLVRRRSEGEPVAYLVGQREFFSLPFQVSPDVLIPRPETEHLVTALLDRAKERPDAPLEILDIGTGSGCIAVTAAVHLPKARITAVDIQGEALRVAEANARQHGVADRITFLQADLLEGLAAIRSEPLDIIVSNPPYIAQEEASLMPPEVREHEPAIALFAGPEGTEVFARLIEQAARWTRAGGWLLAEINALRADRFVSLLEGSPHWQQVQLIRDLAGLPRVVQAARK